VLSAVDRSNRRGFDRACRSTALGLAAELGLKHRLAALSINFMPNAVADPGLCGEQMVEACRAADFPAERIIFEFTESEPVEDMDHLAQVIRAYRAMGFRSAIDDFGAGHSGLTLLARFQPDIVKLDMELVRGIDSDRVRRAIVASIRRMCDDLGVVIVAEGIETAGEYAALRDLGVSLLQGYLFARPQVAALPEPCWPGPR
jgi:EAL domain-containing protein (putative c-di-GMP-specific phosphodiesterase class I)